MAKIFVEDWLTGEVFEAERSSAKFASDANKLKYSRQENKERAQGFGEKLGLPPLHEVDRSLAFTEEQYSVLINQVYPARPTLYYAYMNRENSKDDGEMTQEEIEKHYISSHFPQPKYYSSGGGGAGSINPPRTR